MNPFRLLFPVILISLTPLALAQSDPAKSFDRLKDLAGTWTGSVTTTPHVPQFEPKSLIVTLRVTSMGNALLHEIKAEGHADDPITMFYLDGDKLLLTHYCDAGNRPRMTGKVSDDGKTVDFDFLDVAGSVNKGHMHHAAITFVDADHHTEEWTFALPGDKSVRAKFDLTRTK